MEEIEPDWTPGKDFNEDDVICCSCKGICTCECSICNEEYYCPGPLSADFSHKKLARLSGVITRLNCSFNNLTELKVPESVKYLEIGYNEFKVFPKLPKILFSLGCSFTNIDVLPDLPETLLELECEGNELGHLPILPKFLEDLNCCGTGVSILPKLPDTLKILRCAGNHIDSLPYLPSSLEYLGCYDNDLVILPELPKNLRFLHAQINNLVSLPELPKSLRNIDITTNPNLVNVNLVPLVESFRYSSTLKSIDGVLLDKINFSLHGYYAIHMLQRRMRRRFSKKTKAAKIIQKHLENWLFKPKCNDGTVGIAVRLGARALAVQGFIN